MKLRIPRHADHRFRRMPSTRSDGSRPPIPNHVVRRTRLRLGEWGDGGVTRAGKRHWMT